MAPLLLFAGIATALAFALSCAGKANSRAAFEQAVRDLRLVPPRLTKLVALAVLAAESAVVVLIVLGGIVPGTVLLQAGFPPGAGLAGAVHRSIDLRPRPPALHVVCLLWLHHQAGVGLGCGAERWPTALRRCRLLGRGSARTTALRPLPLAEGGLVAVVAVIFVLIGVQLGEIAQVFKPGVAPRPQA